MKETETKIVDIQLNYSAAVEGLAKYEVKVREAKMAQEELRKALERGEISQQEYDKAVVASRTELTQLKNEQRQLQKELQNQVKAENEASGSLNELRAQLSNLTAQYDALSAAQREGDVGKQLKDQINEITNTLKAAEEGTQRYYRNVGNYTESIKQAFGSLDKELEKVKTDYEAAAAASEKATKAAEQAKTAYEDAAKAEGETSEKTKQLRENYVNLSIAAKDAAKKAETLRNQMKTNEQAINATREATEKLYVNMIPFGNVLMPMLSRGLTGLKEGFKLAAEGAKIVGKQFLALMANPIVAFLAAIAAAIALIVKGVKGSEENTNKLSKILAPLNMLLGALQTALEKVCGWILTGIEYAGKLAQLLGRVVQVATADIPLVGDAVRAANEAVEKAIELEERSQRLVKERRALMVEEAKNERELADLREQAADGAKTNAERLEALTKAAQLEEQVATERVRLAKEELQLAKEQAEMAPNSAADNERLAELEAKVYQEEARLFQQRKDLTKQMSRLREQATKEAEAAAKAKADAVAAAEKKEVEAIQAAEDAMIAIIKDADEKRKAEITARYTREIEALQNRLNTEKDLTAAARDAIAQTITAKEEQMQNDLTAIDDAAEKKRLEAEAKALEDAKKLREDAAKEEMLRVQNDWTEKLQQAADNSVEQARIELERARENRDNLQREEEESEQEFRARQLEANAEYLAAKKNLADQEVQVEQAKMQMITSLAGGFSKTLAALGEDSKAFAKMSKILALGEIAVNTGKAIAAGTAQAQSVPFPANLVAVATTVATVLANIASAISTVKSAKFAAGAIGIGGAGTGTNDKIPAMISNGESVINAAATALFPNELAAINEIGRHVTPEIGGLTINNAQPSLFGEQMREAVEEIHPVVYVEDINLGQKSVEVAEKRGVL